MPPITPKDDSTLDMLRRRCLGAFALLICFFAILVTRLWYLQIRHGQEFSRRADNNRVRTVELAAPRGNIYDRYGREIVTNRPSFNVVWTRDRGAFDEPLLKRMAAILGVDMAELLKRIRRSAGQPRHLPIRLAEDIDWETMAYIENNRFALPGIRIDVVPVRHYHYGDLASHIIGYLGEINRKELQSQPAGLYRGGDLIGKRGLEKLLEAELRGEKGKRYMEVNALGYEQRFLKEIEPLPGKDVHLTIDVELQRTAEQAMAEGDRAGAVVVLEVNSGRVLAAVSAPNLHLQDFVGGISAKAWKALQEDPRRPLYNRVVQGQYPPGSTYKLVTALAGLAEGIITPTTVIYCPGYHHLGNRVYRCWKRVGHGAVDLERALAESCDVYFYQVGQRLGVDRIAAYARRMGLGRRTGVEMEHEKRGLVPTSAWKKRRFNQPWQEGETLSVAIGQGFDLVTPLQLTLMTATVANGGTLYRPSLIEKIVDPDGRVVRRFSPEIVDRLEGQGRNLRLIRQALVEAVNGRHGTGRQARLEGITVAGKTGTAQVVRTKVYRHMKEEEIPYRFRDHAWFTCFAPAGNPEIAVTVLVEHGLHGGSGAAPVARRVLEAYFRQRLDRLRQVEVVDLDPARLVALLRRTH